MLPSSRTTSMRDRSTDIRSCVKKAQRDAVVDLVTSTIDVFLSRPCEEPQVLSIRVPDLNVTVAEVTPAEASKMVNNPHYDKLLEAAENKKRVHAACAAARQFLVEHSMTKNPFCPSAQKTHGVSAVEPKPDKVDLTYKDNDGNIQRRHVANVLRPSGLVSSTTTSATSIKSNTENQKLTSSTRSTRSQSVKTSDKKSRR